MQACSEEAGKGRGTAINSSSSTFHSQSPAPTCFLSSWGAPVGDFYLL